MVSESTARVWSPEGVRIDSRSHFFWSTDGLPEADRLDFWQDAVSRALFGMEVSSPVVKGFRSFLRGARLDAVIVYSLGGSARLASRSEKNILQSIRHDYYLVADFSRSWAFNFKGGSLELQPGDLVIADTRCPHSAHFPSDSEQRINILLPPQWIAKWVRDVDQLVGQRISGDLGWGRALSSYVRHLRPETVLESAIDPQRLVDQLGGLLSLVESELSPLCDGRAAKPTLTDRVHEVVRDRSDDVSLSAMDVASELGVSERTLHRHLNASNTTFGALLQESRVRAARSMLQAANLRGLTTAEIGFRAGFADPSHFARVMGARLQQSPASYRRVIVAGTAGLAVPD